MTEKKITRVKEIGRVMNNIAVLRRESIQRVEEIPGAPAPAQRELIGILLRHPKGITIKDIARIARVTSSAATQRVEVLERMGVAVRNSLPYDNRVVSVALTSLGKKKAEGKLKRFAQSLDRSCLHVLDDEELKILNSLLTKVSQVLEPTGK